MDNRIWIGRYLFHILFRIQVVHFEFCIGKEDRLFGLIILFHDLKLCFELIVQKDSPYLRCAAVLGYGYDKIIYRHKIMRCCSLTDNVASIRNRDAARIAAFIGKHFCFSVFRKNGRGRICKVIASIVFYSQAADQISRESGTF